MNVDVTIKAELLFAFWANDRQSRFVSCVTTHNEFIEGGLGKLSKNMFYMQYYLEEKRNGKEFYSTNCTAEDFKQWAYVSKTQSNYRACNSFCHIFMEFDHKHLKSCSFKIFKFFSVGS